MRLSGLSRAELESEIVRLVFASVEAVNAMAEADAASAIETLIEAVAPYSEPVDDGTVMVIVAIGGGTCEDATSPQGRSGG